MRLLTSLSDIGWIDEAVAETRKSTRGTVATCIPPVFTSYAKIFHPIYEDLSVGDTEQTWQDEKNAKAPEPEPATDTQRIIAEALRVSTLVYGGARRGSRLLRLRWAELAGRLGMTFVPTLSGWSFTRHYPGGSWPRRLIGPPEGNLDDAELGALASILRRHTVDDRILFHFWFLATMDWKEDKVFEGTLDEVDLFLDGTLGVCRTPTHWFPEDRRWLVCSDYDLTFTLIGGSEVLIRELLNDPVLECVPVGPETRVDWHADLEANPHR